MSTSAPSRPTSGARDSDAAGARLGGWTVPAAVLLVALLVAVPVAAFSGAAAPLALGDAGPVVRWGLALVGVVHDVMAALTVGLLFVAAFLVPEHRTTDRRGTAARAAAVAAGVWALAALVILYLTFAELAGFPPSTPGYLGQLLENLWPLELMRLLLIELLMIVALVPLALWARTRVSLAWATALAVAALIPLAFTGHSAGTYGHDTAVNALALHLIGITVWVGGLLAIAVLMPVLGKALPATVARFSTVAGWCFAIVGISGVLFSTITVQDLEGLSTAYGTILLLKVALLLVLGVAGWLQRRTIVAKGVDSPRRFARLALGELVVMGLLVGLGVVLSRTPPPVPEVEPRDSATNLTGYPMPEAWSWENMLTVWRIEWLFTFTALTMIGLYVWAMVRLHRRGDSWPVGRLILWVLGWAVFVYTTSGAPGVYGRVMFSLHMVMHMSLMMAVPILLVPAQAMTLALRALPARRDKTLGPREVLLGFAHSGWAKFISNPVVAGAIFFGSLVTFYWSGMLAWALSTHAGHLFMVVHFTLSGYAFVWSLVGQDPGPPKWPAPLRVIVLLATLAGHAFFGLALMQGTWLLAPEFFKTLALPYVPDLLADQQLGGTIAWGIGELPTVVLMLMVAVDWMRRDEREARRSDRQADRDDDAALAAYNARLADMAARTRRNS
ncbi:cytochrome c oxidase assembly protein [Ornithinimicrobium panacihumi]|uniref:cytochrome c oxidase assembly protein n=1 Tax=Ornithinimicrobium panacihumi TaxID=2008449 RepID=UPI003F88F4D6